MLCPAIVIAVQSEALSSASHASVVRAIGHPLEAAEGRHYMQMMDDDSDTRWGWHYTLAMLGSGVIALAFATALQLIAKHPFGHDSGFGYGAMMMVLGPPLGLIMDACAWIKAIIRARLARSRGQSPAHASTPLLTDRLSRRGG